MYINTHPIPKKQLLAIPFSYQEIAERGGLCLNSPKVSLFIYAVFDSNVFHSHPSIHPSS